MRQVFIVALVVAHAASCAVLSEPAVSLPSADFSVPDTAYPPPENARYVSMQGNDGNPGTVDAPWRTIARAINSTVDGGTIVVRGGTYREGGINFYKNLTIQPYPHEQVWLSGAQNVTGFVKDGWRRRWRKDGWIHIFVDQAGRPIGTTVDPLKIAPSHPMAGWPDMIWISGAYKRQVGSLAELSAGEFYVDYPGRRLYLGDDPTGKVVEAAVLTYGLNLEGGTGGTVRGIGFMRYATHHVQPHVAALRVNKPGVTVENCAVIENATDGVAIYGSDSVVRGCKLMHNGKNGLGTYQSRRVIVENNRVSRNNREDYEPFWDAAGMKIVATRDGIFRDNLYEDNRAGGFWCDITCVDTTVVRNEFRRNQAFAITYELSARGTIASNWIEDTDGAGIYVLESNGLLISDNTLARNGVNLLIAERDRVGSAADKALGATWDTHDVSIRNNVLVSKDNALSASFVDWDGGTAATSFLAELDHNTYLRSAAPGSAGLIEFQTSPEARVRYPNLTAFRGAYPRYEAHGEEGSAEGSPY